jgi:tetratricopeptide (TPR) repeat protein
VREAAEFQTAGFVELLCEESRRAAGDSAARAAHLAACAVAAAAAVPAAGEGWRRRLEGYGRTHLANAQRVGGDLKHADHELTRAEELWTAGAGDDPGLLNEARVLRLQPALRRDQRRLPEALALLERALAIDCWGETAKLLMSKAKAPEKLGQHEAAITLLLQAGARLDDQHPLRNLCVVGQGLLVNLCHLGRHAEAELGFAEVRALVAKLGNQLDLLRVDWLQGRIAAGLGLPILGKILGQLHPATTHPTPTSPTTHHAPPPIGSRRRSTAPCAAARTPR